MPARFDLLAKLFLGESMSAYELDAHDFDLGRFGDRDGRDGPARILFDGEGVLDFGAGISGVLITFEDFLSIVEELFLVEWIADF